MSRLLGLGLLALFTAFVVGQSPHLVHHLFDRDGDAECQLAASGERHQAIAEASAVTVFRPAAAGTAAVAAVAPGTRPVRPARPVRAPPSLA